MGDHPNNLGGPAPSHSQDLKVGAGLPWRRNSAQEQQPSYALNPRISSSPFLDLLPYRCTCLAGPFNHVRRLIPAINLFSPTCSVSLIEPWQIFRQTTSRIEGESVCNSEQLTRSQSATVLLHDGVGSIWVLEHQIPHIPTNTHNICRGFVQPYSLYIHLTNICNEWWMVSQTGTVPKLREFTG